jgi:hypothetical protein
VHSTDNSQPDDEGAPPRIDALYKLGTTKDAQQFQPAEKTETFTKIGETIVLEAKGKHYNAKRGKGAGAPTLYDAQASLIKKLNGEIARLEKASSRDCTGTTAKLLAEKRQLRDKLLKG